MQDCVIRGNPDKAFLVTNGAKAVFKNCLFIGPDSGEQGGGVLSGGEATLDHCTFYRFGTGLKADRTCPRLRVTACAFVQCREAYRIQPQNTVDTTELFVLDGYTGPLPPWSIPSLKGKGKDGTDIGASLDPAKFVNTINNGK